MRFKKLRFFIGVSMVIFIFIIGNIILFGELAKADSEHKTVTVIKNNAIILVPVPTSSETKKINVPVSAVKNEPIINKPVVKNNPVIVHRKIRTRAS